MFIILCGIIFYSAYNFIAYAQYFTSTLPPPPAIVDAPPAANSADSIMMPFPVQNTVPQNYEDIMENEFAADLSTPSNIKTEAEYDPTTGCYIIRTKLGNQELSTPFMLSADEYNNMTLKQSMIDYYRQKNSDLVLNKNKNEFNFLDMNFALGPLEKVFGPGGVQLKTQGSVQIKMGIKSNKTDNPAISLNSRRKTYFDFDQKIQATIAASVGDKLKFNMTYNTDATFDFDTKNLKLQFEGKEDDIIKSIEAGNVSMTTGSTLIKGSTALFGVKTKMQFGKLTATALVSQQNSESKTVNTKGGVQTTSFSINCDNYDQNRHYFLGHFFYNNYDDFTAKLPYVSSGVSIGRIEVWITNKRGNYDESRNLVAFMDMGENKVIENTHWIGNTSFDNPANNSNNLIEELNTQYPNARYISQVTQVLDPLSVYGIVGGKDYEKVESARMLKESEYTFNKDLGYISLKTALNADEVLAVAYQYTYKGQVFQVGEFSSDITDTNQSLYLKMLKSTTASPHVKMWKLMMKNVYSLGAYQVQKNKFRFDIKYISDTTGTQIVYLPVGKISNTPLLQVMNLDRIDSNQQQHPDGFFDFIDGYTIYPSTGKVVFPVVEPFGEHLVKKIGDPELAKKYVYKELYDSTLTVARQNQDKNKFVMTGEYQASSGSQIRLNAMNVPRGSVVVTAGGVKLTENSDYTVDYNMGTVTITNQSIIDSGTSVSVTLENQSLFSTQRKTLLGLDLNYAFSKKFNVGATVMHFSEKAITEKVSIGKEVISNTIWGLNFSYNNEFMWLTNLVNKIPTVNATAPSTISLSGEFAHLVPHKQKASSNAGSSYIDDFESTQTGIDMRSPYSWFLASTPYDPSPEALFPEAALSNNVRYGMNRSLLSWYYIDRLFTQKNSSLAPGYIKNDLDQLSNPYVREVTSREIFPDRELGYGESSVIQTLNLSFYPRERGPYNLNVEDLADDGTFKTPEEKWGGIMRKLDNTNFETSNIEYIKFWVMNPFLDEKNPNREGGDLYFNLGEISEDILKDGLKSYENGLPLDGNTSRLAETKWGRVSRETSLTYAFDNTTGARVKQDVGLDGLKNEDEFEFSSYKEYLDALEVKLPPPTIALMKTNQFSPFRDPAGDNYHFYRGYDYDEERLSILQRYKHYNGVEGNSLSPEDAKDGLYQSARSVPDVEDINQDNTLNEFERYFQYKISFRPNDLEVGKNYITDKQVSTVRLRNGDDAQVEWLQFKIPLKEYQKKVGSISDFSTIRFVRMFMTGFKEETHLRFATLQLVRGEWRPYDYNLNSRNDTPADAKLDVGVVNIEENSGREPVNYVLPPGVSRIVDPGQSQITQLNEQSMSMTLTGLKAGDARGVYKNTSLDLRVYKRLQMFVHAEALINNSNSLKNGDMSIFVRMGTDIKYNYYEYEIPLDITPPGKYNTYNINDQLAVWPQANMLDCLLDVFTNLKKDRNAERRMENTDVSYGKVFSKYDPNHLRNKVSIIGNPSLSDVRVMLVGVRNTSSSIKDATVWVNELKVTEFNEEGGWAAKGNINLNVSDIATLNIGGHKETIGFGAVDQGLSDRRIDDLSQYNVAVQVDLGRFLPEKAKLKAPIYYSVAKEKTTPKYNPLDQDILLQDALDAAKSKAEKDSISNFAVERKTVESFSVSGLKFDVQSKNPMPWDPANFSLSYSSNKQQNINPTTTYENTNDYRGSLEYSYSPYIKPFTPFSFIKSKSKHLKFIKEWELSYLPTSIGLFTNISRYYYEQQTRSEVDVDIQLPVSVSKNFIWDRKLSLTWNLTKQLSLSFNSNTTAHIEETMGAVNKKLFPDKYSNWRDTVWNSIKNLGTPWSYNQTFVASYKAPFSKIPALNFINSSVTYNSTYKWDKGATIDDTNIGNTIANQSSWNVDARINLEQLYGKNKYLSEVNKRFSTSNRQNDRAKKARKFDRTISLKPDTTIIIKHNLRTKKVKLSAMTTDGKPFAVKSKIIDDNNIEVLTKGNTNIKFSITEVLNETKDVWYEIAQHSTRFAMLVRNVSFRWRSTQTTSLPQFGPNIGSIFGQGSQNGILSPGLGFAFGFSDESYITEAKEKGWLMVDEYQTAPAIFSKTSEMNFEINLEPIKGLKILLTANRTDNRTNQIQFMYDNMPTIYSGSYTKTHCAIATALFTPSSNNNYESNSFNQFINNIDIVANRLNQEYSNIDVPRSVSTDVERDATTAYPKGKVNPASSDVRIPAFVAAYTGIDANNVNLSPFPSLASILPNWRVTYDGIVQIGQLRDIFKSFTITHAYQCTYSVGSYSSDMNWIRMEGEKGYIFDNNAKSWTPSSPYIISSVAITEKFAPLIGFSATMQNNITFNAEYRDSRTLTLNSSAGQMVEASTKGIVVGAGYKIANFNTFLKMKGSQQGVSNDLTLNLDFSLSNSQALIRRIENLTTQATSGTRTMSINFIANYILSKRITLGAYFDHQMNTPLVSTSAYPTTNSNYGISVNLSLAK